jgi:hypothetical protein
MHADGVQRHPVRHPHSGLTRECAMPAPAWKLRCAGIVDQAKWIKA